MLLGNLVIGKVRTEVSFYKFGETKKATLITNIAVRCFALSKNVVFRVLPTSYQCLSQEKSIREGRKKSNELLANAIKL